MKLPDIPEAALGRVVRRLLRRFSVDVVVFFDRLSLTRPLPVQRLFELGDAPD
jgi:hypothetical protein